VVKGIRISHKQGEQQPDLLSNENRSAGIVDGRIVVLVEQISPSDILTEMLTGAGYQVDVMQHLSEFQATCGSGIVPLAVILDRSFDQNELANVLADMQKNCPHRVPVIYISAQHEVANRLAAYRAGASHYLPKPVVKSHFLRILAESTLLTPEYPYRIMLVDDASEQQAVHALMLRQTGMEVSVVNTPLQVPEMLDKFAADVLVLGMDMADCTGPELATILHDDPRYTAIPVIYLSAEADLLLQLKSIKNSSDYYLSKQVAAGHLVSVISKHAHRHRSSKKKADVLSVARYELERQQQAIDSHAIVSVADLHGNIIYANDKFCQVSGYSSKELIGKNHRIVKSAYHPDAFFTDMWHTISGGNIWQGEVCNRSKQGALYWVETSIIPFLDENGLPYQYISIRTDITHVKASEIAMQEAKEAAEAGSRAKSEFLASMSHELRTPLNAILGFSQLFGMDKNLPQATRENARLIEHAGEHLLSLVNDLIDLARIEASKMELSLELVEVQSVVNDSLEMVQSMAFNKGISIELKQCEVKTFTVLADFNRLRQSLINLLTNAIKYNCAQGTVTVACEVSAGLMRILVTDKGVGIPSENHARIFNAFDRLGEERGEIEGTGIGLVITKRLMEAMGGGVGFKSVVGEGSTFWVELPLALQPANHHQNRLVKMSQQTTLPVEQAPLIKRVVLYIEDNPMNLRLMQQVFSGKKEWELRGAINAEIGLEMAKMDPPDLILLDINLPGMDGYQALALLKAGTETKHIPVIALSANAMKGDRERGMKAGFVDYLTKPLDILMLLSLLNKIL
jgi:PAS domain S-box-containing protein